MNPTPTATPTACLAGEVSRLDFEGLPPPVRTIARQCLFDLVGVAVAGASSTGPSIVADLVANEDGTGQRGLVTVFGRGRVAAVGGAALANGISAHVLDYDDVLPAMTGHPSAPVVPAALAVAEDLGSSGRDLLTALVAGVETEARVGAAVAPAHYARGFHTTGTAGAVGAAAACARLYRLDADRTEMALGLAVAQAAGLKCMFGTMAKSLHVGHAAATGVLAAQLAAAGFTSCEDALATDQGFGATFADGADSGLLEAPFGEPWYVLDILFKVHAACFYSHAAIEAMLFAREVVDVRVIDSIELSVHPEQTGVCCIPQPKTPLEGKFSLQFVSALAFIRGHANEADFADLSLSDPDLVALRNRVTVVADPDMGPLACRAIVRTTDGKIPISGARDANCRGWQSEPHEQEARLVDKFNALVEPVLGRERAASVLAAVARLEGGSDVRGFLDLLAHEPLPATNLAAVTALGVERTGPK